MSLLLVLVRSACSLVFILQVTKQTDNTTKSDRGSTVTSSALNNLYDTSPYGGLEEKVTNWLQSKRPAGDMTTTRTDLSASDLNKSSDTRSNNIEDSRKIAANYTTASNNDFLQNVSYGTPPTLQSLNPQRVPKVENTSTSPTFESSLSVDSTSFPALASVDDFVSITLADILFCLHEGKIQRFNNTAGRISFAQRGFSRNGTCTIEFVAPLDMVIEMFIYFNTIPCFHDCHYYNNCSYLLVIMDFVTEYIKVVTCSPVLKRLVSPGHKVLFEITVQHTNASIDLSINFTARPPPQLEVVFLTPMTGYVQSPDWDGMMNYPSHLDIKKQLEVPDNHSVMISFQNMDIDGYLQCPFDSLTISVENKIDGKLLKLVFCNSNLILKAAVFHTDAILFHFVSNEVVEFLGFKLYFSFHNQSEIPEELENGKWNCSVPYWPRFQLHFNCNKVEECNGGEDEDNCGYSNNGCGRGFFSIDTRCYSFVSAKEHVTWNEATNECFRGESYLASLNNPKEWEKVTKSIMRNILEPVYIGLQMTGTTFPYLYRDRYQWTDGSAVFFANVIHSRESTAHCSALMPHDMYTGSNFVQTYLCDKNATRSFLCEKNMLPKDGHKEKSQDIVLHPVQWKNIGGKYVTCPSGHVILMMLACDPRTACWDDQYNTLTPACQYPGKPPPPSLQCTSGEDSVPYTLVCDHRPDCSDNSDESFCVFPSCQVSGMFQCANKQCVPYSKRCDKIPHCFDGSDETNCPVYNLGKMLTPEPPAIIYFDGHGSYDVKPLDIHSNQSQTFNTDICPETHFLCPGNLTYCMPVFVRCNGVYDCPGREDEDGCDSYQCPGFYRCRASSVCVHASHLCDGVFQCPQHDDELLCEATCPENCSCQGLAFYCHGQFPAEQYPELRFLHAPESGLQLERLELNSMLIYLTLAKCDLKYFDNVDFPNLQILDLSHNDLVSFKTNQLTSISNLQKLSLAGNPLKYLFDTEHESYLQFSQLLTLDLSSVLLPELNVTILAIFPELMFLNLSGSGVMQISGEGFQSFRFLRHLDVRGCPLTEFPKDIFRDLNGLKEVWADNYKLCCQEALPENFLPRNCYSPSDEISSCDALLRSDFYRVVLSAFAVFALMGNLGSFVYRVFINPKASNLGFGVFVTHLCVSDFLMGVYLAMIGIADRMYQGIYLWKDDEWKQSTGCKLAGFLSLLSSEVSAFLICLITLDRFIVLRFPFSSLYFKEKSAHIACIIVWFTGTVIAGIPLFPVTKHWDFYSQNGICIPLPITRNNADNFAGHTYSFSVIIVVNFIIFVFIAVGQLSIYWSIYTNRMSAGDSNKKNNDIVIARRLITIAMSDFLCWFPIGLLGLMASSGMSIPGEVNVAMAIVAMPINSAINPFLYTINSLMEKRRKASEQRIRKMIMSTFDSKPSELSKTRTGDSHTQQEALRLISRWLSQNLVSPQHVEKVVADAREQKNRFEEKAE